jgi:hypothetical protein
MDLNADQIAQGRAAQIQHKPVGEISVLSRGQRAVAIMSTHLDWNVTNSEAKPAVNRVN